jgi:hypothetical protein
MLNRNRTITECALFAIFAKVCQSLTVLLSIENKEAAPSNGGGFFAFYNTNDGAISTSPEKLELLLS